MDDLRVCGRASKSAISASERALAIPFSGGIAPGFRGVDKAVALPRRSSRGPRRWRPSVAAPNPGSFQGSRAK